MRTFLVFLFCAVAPVFAQRGDKSGEVQADPIPADKIPPAPILSPEESLKTFKLQPGFRLEIVAAEPLVEAPVAMAWHPNGTLYVLEMRGFMPNVDGAGEEKIPGRVKILTDTNGDGRMDEATIFVDGLIMPRAICLAYGGLLVAEPPNLWFFRDTDGDGKADEKTLAVAPYGSKTNPEHTANGLLWGIDNWIYSANYTNRIRNYDGTWVTEPSAAIAGRGQWGLSQDDIGRLVFNGNSDYLRGDLAPSELLYRNPNHPAPYGLNVQFDRNQETFPARMNPGVNRGYTKGQLRADGTLASFTAACAPLVYRGDQFDPSYNGMAFVCEPSGNFVRAARLSEKNGVRTGTNAFPKSEFLTSTDERFRPVNLYNGPDGALYVVDLHRGILQHRIYVTSYLRKQIKARSLETPLDQGRIYRITQENRPRRKVTPLPKRSAELVAQLQNLNGWNRDTAQRLLVEGVEPTAIAPLKKLARSDASTPGSVHALWTLSSIAELDSETLIAALASKNAQTRATAARLAADRPRDALVRPAIIKAASDPEPLVQLYAAFALGPMSDDKSAANALLKIVENHATEPLYCDAAISGLQGREFTILEALAARNAPATFQRFHSALAHAASLSSDANSIDKLVTLAANDNSWRRGAIIDGILNASAGSKRTRTPAKPKLIRVSAQPKGLAALKNDPVMKERVETLEKTLTWPGKEGAAEARVKPLTKEEQELFDFGKETYTLTCAACHQPHGLGQEGLAPPLVESEWVTGSEQRLVRIILQGVRGPLTVKGKQVNLEMPPLSILEDKQIAAIMTYIRREWNHTASPISEEFVKKAREETDNRSEAWTEEDLLKIK